MAEQTDESMGGRLQRLRRNAGFSQRQLAREAGIPLGSLRSWEQGRYLPRLDAAVKVAQALGVSLDELAGIAATLQEKNR